MRLGRRKRSISLIFFGNTLPEEISELQTSVDGWKQCMIRVFIIPPCSFGSVGTFLRVGAHIQSFKGGHCSGPACSVLRVRDSESRNRSRILRESCNELDVCC